MCEMTLFLNSNKLNKMLNSLLLSISLAYFYRVIALEEVVNLVSVNNCSVSQYFDYNTFSCQPCGPGHQKTSDGLSCNCPLPNKLLTSLGATSQRYCLPCQTNEIVSRDQSVCVKKNCANTTISKLTCNLCRGNQILVTHATNGSALPLVQCVTCTSGTQPSADKSQCMPCSYKVAKSNSTFCDCDNKKFTKIQNICVPNDFVKTFPFDVGKKNSIYNSGYFRTNWILNNYLCSLHNKTACQIVANMCVLSLYEPGNDNPCKKWTNHKSAATPPLMYGEDEAYSILLKKKIPTVYSLYEESELNFLNITAIATYPNGTTKHVTEPVSKWLLTCPSKWKYDAKHIFKFAENYRHACRIGAQQLIQQADTVFYEPYLGFTNADVQTLYALPVLLRGNLIKFNKENDINTWQFVRRFYLYDKISGFESNSTTLYGLQFFRYAKKIHVNVRIRRKGKDERNKIYPPLIIIDYDEISSNDINNDADISMEFLVQFELDGGSMSGSIDIAIGTLSAFAILYSLLQTWSFSRRSGKSGFDLFTALHFLLIMTGNLANIFFVVAFGASTFSFILYKFQQLVYAVPPPERDELITEQYVIIAFSLKLIEVAAMNWSQINVDICFLDWEKPNVKVNELDLKIGGYTRDSVASFWRSYFVANEWNEIQTLRKICLPTHLVACVFALEVFDFSSWTNIGVDISPDLPKGSLSSRSYQFALGGLVFLILYFLQLIIRVFVYERFFNNFIQDFMDICSISNVSMLIMDSQYHGYYLHGRCVLATCDNDTRGLLPELPYTAFVFRCTPEFRLCYNRLNIHMIARDEKWEWQHHLLSARENGNIRSSSLTGLQSGRKSAGKSSRRDDGDSRISEISPLPPSLSKREQAHRLMNKFLTAFFDHALEDLDYEVREKKWVERLLDVELIDEGSNRTLLLYNTSGDPQSFQRTIWYGQEWTLATFDLFLFCFIQIMSGSYIVAALISGIFWKIMSVSRQYGGKKNLAKKTLVDERFLV